MPPRLELKDARAALTNHSEPEFRERASRLGCDAFVRKRDKFDDLVRLIVETVGERFAPPLAVQSVQAPTLP